MERAYRPPRTPLRSNSARLWLRQFYMRTEKLVLREWLFERLTLPDTFPHKPQFSFCDCQRACGDDVFKRGWKNVWPSIAAFNALHHGRIGIYRRIGIWYMILAKLVSPPSFLKRLSKMLDGLVAPSVGPIKSNKKLRCVHTYANIHTYVHRNLCLLIASYFLNYLTP